LELEIAIVLRSSPTLGAPIIIINYRYCENLCSVDNSSNARTFSAQREKSHERTDRITRFARSRKAARNGKKLS